MEKNENKSRRRTRKGIFLIGITAVLLVVSTYAWFVGITNVAVNEFELSVQASKGLSLSLDGNVFTTSVDISKESIIDNLEESYATNTNNWIVEGLVPMSSAGVMNTDSSRLNMFAKSSMTTSKGGYKLISDLANGDGEVDGYVVFDLFVKNESGNVYTNAYDKLDDEGIYLDTNSKAELESGGESSALGGDGIENSIRVAFMQIGRVNYKSSKDVVQAISCEDSDVVTGLCNLDDGRGYTYNIWEPNDMKHNSSSVEHFNHICMKRTDTTVYEGNCDEFSDNEYVYTYAANSQITSSDSINIYDGLNGYTNVSDKLTEMEYFRDSTDRVNKNELFYLAPNSITKIRIYIYIEGQDVDNYDLGSSGKKVVLSFGLTKDKYSEEEESNETP